MVSYLLGQSANMLYGRQEARVSTTAKFLSSRKPTDGNICAVTTKEHREKQNCEQRVEHCLRFRLLPRSLHLLQVLFLRLLVNHSNQTIQMVAGNRRPPWMRDGGSIVLRLLSFFHEELEPPLPPPDHTIKRLCVLSCTDGLVLVFAENLTGFRYYVSNILLNEWTPISTPTHLTSQLSSQQYYSLRYNNRLNDTGIVTIIESGVQDYMDLEPLPGKAIISIYSSVLRSWRKFTVPCSDFTALALQESSVSLKARLHWLSQDPRASCIVSGDFSRAIFTGFTVIKFPGEGGVGRFTRSFTTSEDFIVYFQESFNRIFRIWKLVEYGGSADAWEMIWELDFLFLIQSDLGDYFPMVMHPLNSQIIYLWSRKKKAIIVLNLTSEGFTVHKELAEKESCCEDGCSLSFNRCGQYMETIDQIDGPFHYNQLCFSQCVIPSWLPRPL